MAAHPFGVREPDSRFCSARPTSPFSITLTYYLISIILRSNSESSSFALHMNPPAQSLTRIRDWPHSPLHRLSKSGTYMVTSGTYLKQSLFRNPSALTNLTNLLLTMAEKYKWNLQAWAMFPNHYHFVADSENGQSLKTLIQELHSRSAMDINQKDGTPGRKVWFQYWDSQITFHRSYLARLNYVHQNPVRHEVVQRASEYSWCSAGWFELKAEPAFFRTVSSFPIDRLSIPDEYQVALTP